MKLLKENALPFSFSAASFALVLGLWSRLPDPFPTHWNIRGEIDGWTPKPWGPLIMPLTILGLAALFSLLPRISPEKFSIERFGRVYRIITASISAVLFAVTVLTTLAGAGFGVDVGRGITIAIGVLFIVLGNFMGKLTRNLFVGIRTPWTIASDEVWLRTHRFGGKVFVLAGVGALVGSLIGYGVQALMAGAGFAAISSIVYSYVAWRDLGSPKGD